MKKQIIINNELTPFWIYDNGQLWREDTNCWYKPYENGGYLSYHLKWHNKTFPFRIHRLVAEYFIPNPENKPFVHHKNHDRYDNNKDNLEWVTVLENNQDKLPKTNHKPICQEIDTEKEEWKQYLNTQFWVSNMGRVKNILTRNILKGNVRENGYIRVGLRYNGKLKSFNLHNLVWLVWRGQQKGVIDHINGDKLDNRLENLQDISQSENIQKAERSYRFIGNSLEKNGEIINIYKSQGAAARALNINSGSINQSIYKGWRAGGYYWRFIKEEDYV